MQASTMAQTGDNADAARALEIAGYPSLLQEYLWQQQQQQQQDRAAAAASAAALESRIALSQGLQQPSQWAGLGGASHPFLAGHQGMNFGVSALGGDVTGMDAFHHQQMDPNQILLDRLQAANAGLPKNVWGGAGLGANSGNGTDQFAENGILGPWSERSAGLLGSMVATGSVNKPTKVKKGRRKQPKDKPKRPLSAYNIFFKEERARLLQKLDDANDKSDEEASSADKKAPSKIGFENLAKIIGSKWQDLTPSQVHYYKGKAAEDMKRYKSEMESYLAKQSAKESKSEGNDGEEVKETTEEVSSEA